MLEKNNNLLPRFMVLVIIIVVTAVLGELKIIAFSSNFRFGLGSAAFFFLLLFYKQVSYPLIGAAAGIIITFFRIGLNYLFDETFIFYDSFLEHSPIIGYYFTFSLLLFLGQARKFYDKPLILGLIGAFTDGFANIVELSIRTVITGDFLLHLSNIEYVIVIAVFRSFFVVGLFNIIHTNQMKVIYIEQQKRFEKVQMITSGLYVEVFYLKKLLNEIERITATGFELYQKLKKYKEVPQELATSALSVVQEVHEVKKDNQRILAGLEKIVQQEMVITRMLLSDLINLIVSSNQKYSLMLNKEIEFKQNQKVNYEIDKIYPVVVIMNNLIANSVEAIEGVGTVELYVTENDGNIQIKIIDDGTGIHPGEETVIFEPGYTTKFDTYGKPSTGIGLSHVKSMIEKLHGDINVSLEKSKTIFTVTFPVKELLEG